MPRNALGKGLSALIREPEPQPVPAPPPVATPRPPAGGPQQVDIDLIDPNPWQPRTRFPEEQMRELASSIRASGVIQPLILRPLGARYQLIAGERRWRAAQQAGLHRVPAVVREANDAQALELTLVENIQREDLNPMDQARAFSRLMTEFQLTQEEVAERTGKERATVANALRLLKLEPAIQQFIEEGKISAGHARALLMFAESSERAALAQRAARGLLTVRQLERLAAKKGKVKSAPAAEEALDPNISAAIEELQRVLGTRIHFRPRTSRSPGQLILEFYDDAHLMGLYDRLIKS
jgi:ParB family chromosome partitioning protein